MMVNEVRTPLFGWLIYPIKQNIAMSNNRDLGSLIPRVLKKAEVSHFYISDPYHLQQTKTLGLTVAGLPPQCLNIFFKISCVGKMIFCYMQKLQFKI